MEDVGAGGLGRQVVSAGRRRLARGPGRWRRGWSGRTPARAGVWLVSAGHRHLRVSARRHCWLCWR